MQATSFLLGSLIIVCAYDMLQAAPSGNSAQQVLKTLNFPDCPDPLYVRLACLKRKFRTFDGTCNNLCNTKAGAVNQPLRRLPSLVNPAAYEANFQPRSSSAVAGKSLPNARTISRIVFNSTTTDVNETAPNFTHMTMTWGQFLDHDITLTELIPDSDCGVNNAQCPIKTGCIGIDIQSSDQLLGNRNAQCIPLRRSLQNDYGDQINLLTSYIDASHVYGSDEQLAGRLRNQDNPKFLDVRPFVNFGDQKILPPADEEAFCRSPKPVDRPCFIAGDIRVNENQALMAMHAIWAREHNRIAWALHSLNPSWDDERVFQEARKIVGAEIQHITYNEWIPVLFDKSVRDKFGLTLEKPGQFFNGYDPTADPQMINCFSTAALRMGHTLVRNSFPLLDSRFSRQGFGNPLSIPTSDFFNPDRLYEAGNNAYGGILLGLVARNAQQVDGHFVPAVRERLIIEGPTTAGIIGDLPAINIQRGRDHGLPPYVKFRKAVGAGAANSFADLSNTTSSRQIALLQKAYHDILYDVDLFAGAIVEFPAHGSALGATFTHILGEQFRDLRRGDRFWYERNDTCTAFNLAQLTEIRKVTLARVICDNADGVTNIQRNVFQPRVDNNGVDLSVSCGSLEFANLEVFRDGSGVEPSAGSEGGQEASLSEVGV